MIFSQLRVHLDTKLLIMRLLLYLLILIPGLVRAQVSLEEKIGEVMTKYKAVGLSVAVVKDNKPFYQKAFGKQSLETGQALKENNIFRIASISKSFSATSVMQLIEAGKLSLNDDMTKLMGFTVRNPKYPFAVITLKMVLSHTSSINDSQGYFQLDAINPDKNPNWEKCYNNYAPGMGYEYCNLNFNMVGSIIEKTSGLRFDQYVVKNILNPLNIYGGYCVDSLDQKLIASIYNYDTLSQKYVLSDGAYNPRREEIRNYVFGYSTPIFSPTGGMKISAPDLARYMTMHMNYGKLGKVKIISKKSSKIMQTPVSDIESYGLALWKTAKFIDGESLVGHTGSAYGLYSCMFFNPKKKFGIVAITNGCKEPETDSYNQFLKEIANILYLDLVK